MIRGFYTAASGLITQEKVLNNHANNISNVSTVGYKRDGMIAGTFGEHMSLRMNAYQEGQRAEIGRGVYMQTIDSKYTDYTEGGYLQTDRSVDMTIQGAGFFLIADGEGNQYLTRDGQFAIDEEGYLVLHGYGRVQGENGDIQPGTSEIGVDRFGNIYTYDEDGEAEELDRLAIALPEDYAQLEKLATGLYVSEDYVLAEEGEATVLQGVLERSNVDMSVEMTGMIASQRSLQSCSQLVKMYDEMTEQIISRISRI